MTYSKTVLSGHVFLFFSGFFLLFLIGVSPSLTHAQSVTEQARRNSVVISANPSHPTPGEEFNLSASSFLVPLEGATFQWAVNGQIIDEGAGVTQTSYVMPEDGSEITVTLTVQPTDGQSITKQTTIQAVTIDLIWEANTFTPPLYKGKALYSGVGNITVTALPFISNSTGDRYDKENLVYRWSHNSLVHGSDSGLGKNTFPVDLNTRNNTISVTISDRSGNTVGEASTSIPTADPQLLLYENHPLRGIHLGKPLEEVNTEDEETRITAYPYFFPANSAVGETLEYRWYLAGEQIASSDNKNEVVLRDTGEDGEVDLSVDVESTEFIFSPENTSLLVTF